MRWLTNIDKTKKETVLAAARESGQDVRWHDEPDEKMPPSMRDQYGSIYAEPRDCSAFWAAYRRIDGSVLSDSSGAPPASQEE
jgi:hypothetical protein